MKKKTKKWFLDNVFNIIAVILIIALLIFASGIYTQGFTTILTEKASASQESKLEETQNADCTITIVPSSVDYGDSVTGLIYTKTPNTFCEIFSRLKDDDTWRKIAEGTTDIDGNLASTEEIYVSGDFVFAALCGDCRTNDAYLNVKPEIITDCTDTDGINKMTAGWVVDDGIYYYDDCTDNVVTEYYCNDGVDTRILPCDDGYECYETRSGDYCISIEPETFTCTDTDGGLDYMTRGVCESSFDMTGNIDTCSSQAIINERFCSAIGTCITASVPCPPPFICIEGACVPV